MKSLLLPLLILFFLIALVSGCSSSRRSEPLRGPLEKVNAKVLNGQKVFMKNCHKCHPQGEAGLGPALNDKGFVPTFIVKFQIRNGLGVMPSFSSERIPPDDLDDLIDYLKALRRND